MRRPRLTGDDDIGKGASQRLYLYFNTEKGERGREGRREGEDASQRPDARTRQKAQVTGDDEIITYRRTVGDRGA